MLRRCVLIGVAFATLVIAHGGHTPVNTQEEAKKPVSAKTWIHIALEATSWMVLFPLAMVLGLVRHKLHVPLASGAVAMSLVGYVLGGHHGGRQFPHTVHGTMAKILLLVLIIQTFCGIYLKLHLQWKPEKVLRPIILRAHGIFGRMFPILGWTQMVFGIATLQSWCRGGHLGQCLAHYIMGSAFAGYSVILLIMLKCAVEWLRRKNVSEEYLDSWVILLWGIVNTFTEHHGGPWTHKDLQHTLMGVLWWTGGAVGIWLSRKGKRSIFPAIIISLTGWGMSGHAQALKMLSTMVHSLFGYALMAAGVCRIIEICFVLKDKPTGEETLGESDHGWFKIHAFQYLPPFLLTTSGILFMSATDEELRWADAKGVDHVTWGMIDFSVALLLFFWMNVLIDTEIASSTVLGIAAMSFFVRSRLASVATLHRLALPVGATVAVTALSVAQSPLLLEGETKKYDYADRTKPRPAPVIKRRVIVEEVEVDEEEEEEPADAEAVESSSNSESVATETETAYDPNNQESAFDERTGEINWDCPCLGGMAQGPCGEQFKKAFSCFIFSEQEPKGIDCVDHFKEMQNCFREHPEVYAEEIEADNAAEADIAAAGDFAAADAETA
ncbi:hypothetical protein MYAM1_001794 [Malassezia yamatoensis]|uniref:Mitochondrial intermembrane space import and assembly protein 40 n=1 Tax=Malassezia yamatoensis TaxID=253288 RepID=A0AAJ6CHQ7_9BASI|nr:hypothetical protein MYAM1_001794 [Malassezia yamatoensis]